MIPFCAWTLLIGQFGGHLTC